MEELRRDYRLYVLSNTNPFVMDWARSSEFSPAGKPLDAYFDKLFLSYEMKCMKPDRAIFDRMAAEELAKIAGLNIREYASEMFRSSSRLRDRSMDELFHMDFKYFQVQNKKIAISQITSVSENELNGIRDKMLDYMEDYLKTSGLSMQFVMLTDIIEEKTELLYVGRGAKNLVHTAFRKECGEHSVVLPGVVSRKKQMVTPLLSAMEEEGTM